MAFDTYVTASNDEFTLSPSAYETYVSVLNEDFREDTTIPVKMIIANPDIFTPAVEWNNGKARIINTKRPDLLGWESTFYFIGGMPAVTSLPDSYDYRPGDSIYIMLGISSTPVSPYNWARKAYAQIFLGTEHPPTDYNMLPHQVTKPTWLLIQDPWVPRGMKEAPTMRLPDKRIFTVVRKRTDITSESIVANMRGGAMAVMDTNVRNEYRINWTHSSDLQTPGSAPPYSGPEPDAYGGKNLSREDIDRAAGSVPCGLFDANELQEGRYSLTELSSQYSQFYEARLRKYRSPVYNELGLPYRDFGTYGGTTNYNGNPWNFQVPGGGNVAPNDPFFKNMISSKDAARQTCSYFFILYNKGVGAIIKHYADQPDYASRYYNKAYAAEVMAKGMDETPTGIAPDKLVYLDWGKIEGISSDDAALHNGYYFHRQVGNLGVLKTDRHPQVDYDWQVGNIFGVGFCRTIGYIIFDSRAPVDQYGTNPNEVKAKDGDWWQWQPNVNGTPAPVTADGYPVEPCRWHDAGYEAAYYYSQCARTEGTPWLYCRYQFKETGVWVEPKTDGTTILEHAAAFDGPYKTTPNARRGRPDAMYRIKDNAVDVWVFDPSRGKNSYETLILNPVENVHIEVNLQGSKLALFNTVQFYF
ncbi:hypothetical protein GCM10028805_21440 [Spirosoma harenae]